eukprot:Clim_evm76s201 gene=Clim_evmTU76s201
MGIDENDKSNTVGASAAITIPKQQEDLRRKQQLSVDQEVDVGGLVQDLELRDDEVDGSQSDDDEASPRSKPRDSTDLGRLQKDQRLYSESPRRVTQLQVQPGVRSAPGSTYTSPRQSTKPQVAVNDTSVRGRPRVSSEGDWDVNTNADGEFSPLRFIAERALGLVDDSQVGVPGSVAPIDLGALEHSSHSVHSTGSEPSSPHRSLAARNKAHERIKQLRQIRSGDVSPAELDEGQDKAKLIAKVLKLQDQIFEKSTQLGQLSDENEKLSAEVKVLVEYSLNLLTASPLFYEVQGKPK